ncbi:phosphatase PAP2 family protein [Candidatus Desantisbacteria bacterium]|nr:phosphatase PAP2 family protein [Candidatus Desantisbacteria bacterium]
MGELLNKIDRFFFILINKTWHNAFLDIFFTFITEKKNWILPLLVLVIFLIIYIKKSRIFLLVGLLSVLITDQLTSNFIKDIIMRPRPFNSIPDTRLLVSTGNFSFPSSHAANIAGIALLATLYYPKFTYIYWISVFLISYSRIYVGVHYPSDVLAGIFIGIICAWVLFKISKLIVNDKYYE